MSKAYTFLKECGAFFVGTVNEAAPAVRPFGAIMEHEGVIYIPTANTKAVYKQISANPKLQLTALKPGTTNWIRVNATAVECKELEIKQAMMEACPVLAQIYGEPANPAFVVFALTEAEAIFYDLMTETFTEKL